MDVNVVKRIIDDNTDRSFIDDVSYRRFQKHYVDSMLEKYAATNTLVTGTLRMFECMDEYATDKITLKDFIEILTEINEYRNKKQTDRLNKTGLR